MADSISQPAFGSQIPHSANRQIRQSPGFEFHCEQDDKKERQPDGGYGVARDAGDRSYSVKGCVSINRGVDTKWNSNRQRQNDGETGEQQGVWHDVQDARGYRL